MWASLGLLHSGLPHIETTQWAESTSHRRDTCPFSRGGLNSISWSSTRCHPSDTPWPCEGTWQQRHPRASPNHCWVFMSQPYNMTRGASVLKIGIFVYLRRYRQHVRPVDLWLQFLAAKWREGWRTGGKEEWKKERKQMEGKKLYSCQNQKASATFQSTW